MARRLPDDRKAQALRDLAVLAVARRGAMERSGRANLAVLQQDGLMIGYYTPFNPLPNAGHSEKYNAALEGRDVTRTAYGIDIWLADSGKVFSAGWTLRDEVHVRLCKPGAWQATLKNIADKIGEETVMPHKKKQPAKSVAKPEALAQSATAVAQPGAMESARSRRLRMLEQENKHLRRAISGLMLDKLILAKAAAGTL